MPIRILIVDDNAFVRTALRHLLAEFHCEIVEAENGRDAISKTIELQPDIAILDLMMPGMDGLTASREIHRRFPDLPILMCTMHWSTQLQLEAQKAGIQKVISKADSRGLLTALRDLVNSGLPAGVRASTHSSSAMVLPDSPGVIQEPPSAPSSAKMIAVRETPKKAVQ